MYMSSAQKSDLTELLRDVKGVGELDYVCGWYQKALAFTMKTPITCAFVSTNSICQGSQVITFWKYIFSNYDIVINYAYRTFVWNSEASNQAKVHCIIVGFSHEDGKRNQRFIIDESGDKSNCTVINPYLTDSEVCFIDSRSKPLCDVPNMRFGSMPRDGGGFVLTPEERDVMIKAEPLSEQWIRPYIGATEFLHSKERYCLWLVGADPGELKKCPTVMKRVEFIRDYRASSKAEGTRKFAATPTLFCQIAQPDSEYIMVPKTSSGKRRYIPLGFMPSDVIASDLVFLIPNAGRYEFGILMSNVHNAWMRVVAGRLKSDYRYAKDIVYNNFPWPSLTEEQKEKIEQTSQGILDARELYPNSSLADLYDELTMPPELRKAHHQNDIAVMKAYGLDVKSTSESDCVAALMKMYRELTQKG